MMLMAIVLCVAALGVLLGHVLLTVRMSQVLGRWRRPRLVDEECPRVAVILCLRGADPFLHTMLPALLDQDYPNYDVVIVADHRDDPAYAMAAEIIRASGNRNVDLAVLHERRETCGLVCSSLVQAIAPRLATHDAIALIDADTVPHRTWLRELMAPLADPGVGVVTGNRWYAPPRAAWGDLVRYFWNVPAMSQMVLYDIPWGGTMALRSEVFRDCGVLDAWSQALAPDVLLYDVLRRANLRVEFLPSLLMVNREAIGMRSFFAWVQRQVMLPRLYHSRWWSVVVQGMAVSIVPAGLLLAVVISLLTGAGSVAAFAGAALVGHMATLLLLVGLLERQARGIIRGRGEQTAWISPAKTLAYVPAFLLTHVVYALALIGAMTRRTIEWRRIDYRVEGPWDVSVVEYRPYDDRPAAVQNASL